MARLRLNALVAAAGWVTSIGGLLAASHAHALEERPLEGVTLAYSAPRTCPSRVELLGRITQYTPHFRLAAEGEDARHFDIRIAREGRAWVGAFDVGEGTGPRSIRGETCDDVVLGLVVAVATALDPHAGLPPETAEKEANVEVREEPPSEPEPAPPVSVPPPRPSERSRPAPAPPPRPVVFAVGLYGGVNGAVSSTLGVFGAFAEASFEPPFARLSWLRPTIRLGAKQSLPRTASVGDSEASVWWTAGALELCPARVTVVDRLTSELCFGTDVGALSAMPKGGAEGGTTRRLWLDYGAALGFRWQMRAHAFAFADLGAWIPLTRDRLRLEPDGVVTEAPRFGISAEFGGGWRF
ncbi:hypothetical protein AKJ09_01526 [Labilithrix luteola]|uniref:Uncharacterized protein n=1 Tax=Labilithrix luteola TaxID=1391654 RepID=A0A0K1PMX0_9BACT|nr:hypothetical protein [Labilithrix luteola]AKU94862.1 hypothetical protein AKJ09_01526 [Labilithrix luteola]